MTFAQTQRPRHQHGPDNSCQEVGTYLQLGIRTTQHSIMQSGHGYLPDRACALRAGKASESRATGGTNPTNANAGAVGLVPKAGFEPARVLPHWFLRPARLPFRHFGKSRTILGNSDRSGQARTLMSIPLLLELWCVGEDPLSDFLAQPDAIVYAPIFRIDESCVCQIEPRDRRA